MRVGTYLFCMVLVAGCAAEVLASDALTHAPEAVIEVSTGEVIDLAQVLVPGKYTVLEFGSPDCGACVQLAPRVESAAKANDRFVLRTITLPMAPTPVAQQFKINALPQFMVYDPDGQLVGSGFYLVDHILKWDPSKFSIGDVGPEPPLWPTAVGFVLILALGTVILYRKMHAPVKQNKAA